jgi:hypothetical protein
VNDRFVLAAWTAFFALVVGALSWATWKMIGAVKRSPPGGRKVAAGLGAGILLFVTGISILLMGVCGFMTINK